MRTKIVSKLATAAMAISLVVSSCVCVFAECTTDIPAMDYKGHHIPAYDGFTPDVKLEEEPCFTEAELVKVPSESYGALDSLGRCTSCYALLNKSIMPQYARTSSLSAITPTGWINKNYSGIVSGGWLYNRSHIIGFQLTGVYGINNEKKELAKQDLITGTQYLNVGGTYSGMDYYENRTAAYLRKSDDNYVAYRVTPVFKDDELVARGVIMEGKAVDDESGAFEDYSVFVYNVQPGVAIDYSSGESKLDISAPFYGATLELPSEEINYTGDSITPRVTVIHNGGKLTEGTDYTLTYKDNTEVGTATVTVTGTGGYWGTVSAQFDIVAEGGDDLDENGDVPGSGEQRDADGDSKPELKNADVTISKSSYAYAGKKLTPVPKVKLDGETLVPGDDYTVKYGTNKYVGSGSVTVTGKGKYTGSKTIKFKIVPRNTSISSLSKGYGYIKVKWRKQSTQTTGYKIRYSTKSSMSDAKTVTVSKNTTISRTIKNLKHKKRYYVQIRTYKKVGSTYYYSPWGTKKYITTR